MVAASEAFPRRTAGHDHNDRIAAAPDLWF